MAIDRVTREENDRKYTEIKEEEYEIVDDEKDKNEKYSLLRYKGKGSLCVLLLNATIKGMQEANEKLKLRPGLVLIDGLKVKGLNFSYESIVKGDTKSASIASASILAKVARDNLMIDYHKLYPAYHFDKNKGYPTKEHREVLSKIGPSPIHRKTFAPVKYFYEKNA